MIKEALRSKEGAIYVAGAGVAVAITLLNLAGIAKAYMGQWELREAVLEFEQGKSTARQKLGRLRTADEGNRDERATVRVLLGAYNYRQARKDPQLLSTAEKLFDEALSIDPERTSAAVGLVCVRLAMAEDRERETRQRDAKHAEAELDRLVGGGGSIPDVEYLRGATMLLQGRLEHAIKKLDDDSPSEAPSAEGQAARFWNLGVARLLDERSDAYKAFAMGYMLRPSLIPYEFDDIPAKQDPKAKTGRNGDAPKILMATYEACLAMNSKDAAELLARCDDVASLLRPFTRGPGQLGKGQLGRFFPHRKYARRLHNALGLAFYKAGAFAKASQQFASASKATRAREPLYLLNLGWARFKHARTLSDPKAVDERRKVMADAAGSFEKVCVLLEKQKGRESTIRLGRLFAAIARTEAANPKGGYGVYRRFSETDPNKAETQRNLGALADHAKQKLQAIRHYRKAIKLNHPDSGELRERVAELEVRK